jgi:tRNA threonylcarbamoyl adenosine modification protein YeaZ
MKLLAIDTSTDYLSLAVMDGEKAVSRIHRSAPRSHSSLLMPMIGRILKRSKIKLKDLDGFCLSIGPGSFTGLRIGAATVKGLAFVTKKPIAAVPTFDAIAENGKRFNGVLCPVLDARKGKVYACIYKSDGKTVKKISGYLLMPAEELIGRLRKYDNVLFLGDFAERAAKLLPASKISAGSWQPKPEAVGRIGAGYFRKRKFVRAEDLEPLYIYSKECDITGK